MKKVILFILIISLTLNAEEFIYKNVTVKSEKTSKIVKCNSFDIKVETKSFPFKYEGRIPSEFRIKNYHGADNLLSRKIFLMPQNTEIIFPTSIQKYILKNRTFLPYKALCKDKKFVVFYSSGGNCKGCEIFIEFDVINHKAVNPMQIDYSKIRTLYQ